MLSNNEKYISKLREGLRKELKVKDLGEAKFCLGIKMERGNEIEIKQRKYTHDILARFGMADCNSCRIPSSPQAALIESPTGQIKNRPYREVMDSLMYLCVATRLDIAHTVHMSVQFCENPSDQPWGAAKRVLRYLKGSADLTFKGPLQKLEGYVDADWGSNPDTRKSYTGYGVYSEAVQ